MTLFLSPLLFVVAVSLSSIVFVLHIPSNGSECNVSRQEATEAMQNIFLLGDPDMIQPKQDSQIDQYCENVLKNGRRIINHISCHNHGSTRLVFGSLAQGALKVRESRCSDKSFREGFLKYVQCTESSESAKDVHQCSYKFHDALIYTLNNIRHDHQLQFSCCAMQYVGGCMIRHLQKDCSDEVVKFAPRLFFESATEAMNASCPGIKSIEQCRQLYPKHIQELDKIYESTTKLSPRKFMVPGYEIHHRRGSRVPEFIDVTK